MTWKPRADGPVADNRSRSSRSSRMLCLSLLLSVVAVSCGAQVDDGSNSAASELATSDRSAPGLSSGPPGELPFAAGSTPTDVEQATSMVADQRTEAANPSGEPAAPTPTPTTDPPRIEFGTRDNPFVELPATPSARAVMTSGGVVLPVIDERADSWLVSTPCQGIRFVSQAEPIGRAHVVLDPGHGGAEVGAAGAGGLREKDLNLLVAMKTATILEQAGATVVLARTGDYSITAASRGLIAKAIDPALFVSIHHNGGAPGGGDRPGTIVFTKSASPASTRFGGLFHQTLQPMLEGAAESERARYQAYAEALAVYEAEVSAYDRAVADRDAALVANGQVPAAATTSIPAPTTSVEPGELRLPPVRRPATTTTAPATTIAGRLPLPIPEPPTPPAPLQVEPVGEFQWAGSGNAGVRSWTRPDGRDYLAVLRHSGDVPAVLAEFLYLTNPSEEELLADPAFVDKEAGVLADAIILYFTTEAEGTGHVADQFDDQPIGGSGGIESCVEPEL